MYHVCRVVFKNSRSKSVKRNTNVLSLVLLDLYSPDKFLGSIFIISAYGTHTYIADFAFSRK